MMAPPPPGLSDDSAWTDFITIAHKIPTEMHPCLMRSIVENTADKALVRQMTRLHFLMIDMQAQQEANNAGWVCGVGYRRRHRHNR